MNELGIHGLKWETNWRVENGKDSFVIPFPTLNPVNVVFHGEEQFDYGHYGVHLGQEDRLTFLGPSDHTITAYFIDCRRGSTTLHKRVQEQFQPSSGRILCIPPGVAHAFDALEGIFTLNSYHLFLPHPSKLTSDSEWKIDGDVINLPMDVSDENLPIFEENSHAASGIFYRLIAQRQRTSIPQLKHQYPFTEDIKINDGRTVRLLFQKKISENKTLPEWEPIEGIEGAGWARHLVIASGEESGFIPLLDERPLYIVDHGEHEYTHDAYGIHLGQEDRLTFLGPSAHNIKLTLVDCRQGSPSLHNKVSLSFHPDPLHYLVIPNGVAHRFEHLERVFTVNRPSVFVTAEEDYEPGNDVIDWPIDNPDYPVLSPHRTPATDSFYARQSMAQKKILSAPPMHATPIVLLTQDSEGRKVRVALRKRTE